MENRQTWVTALFELAWRLPLALVHRLALALHQAYLKLRFARVNAGTAPRLPLLIVGGLRLTGSGKTSMTARLAQAQVDQGRRVAILTYYRPDGLGFRRNRREVPFPFREIQADSPWQEGSDEAVLLKRLVPEARVYATRHRAAAWRSLSLLPNPPDTVLSDDGLLDPRLAGAERLILMRPGERPGWKQLFPAGPYRATLAWVRAGDKIWRGPGEAPGCDFNRVLRWPSGIADSDRRRPIIALCGHGDPEGFFAFLRDKGCLLAATLTVANHGEFNRETLRRLAAKHEPAAFACAPRDAVKLLPPETLGDLRAGFISALRLENGWVGPLWVCGHDLTFPGAIDGARA